MISPHHTTSLSRTRKGAAAGRLTGGGCRGVRPLSAAAACLSRCSAAASRLTAGGGGRTMSAAAGAAASGITGGLCTGGHACTRNVPISTLLSIHVVQHGHRLRVGDHLRDGGVLGGVQGEGNFCSQNSIKSLHIFEEGFLKTISSELNFCRQVRER